MTADDEITEATTDEPTGPTGPPYTDLAEEWADTRAEAQKITRELNEAYAVLSELDVDAGLIAFQCRALNHEIRKALKPLITAEDRTPLAVAVFDHKLAIAEQLTGYDDLLDAAIKLRELMNTFGDPPEDRELFRQEGEFKEEVGRL